MRLINRTFAVMKELSGEPTGLTLQELSERTDVPIGSTHRLLGVLSAEDLIVRCPVTRRYFVGPAAAPIGAAATRSRRLVTEPPAVLVDADLDETLFVTSVIDPNHAVCTAVVYGRRLTRQPALLGSESALGVTPATRVLLGLMHENLLASALRRNVPAQHRPDVLARVRRAGRSGFDAAPHEPAQGFWTLSVPVPFATASSRVSLSIVTSVQRARRESVRLALFKHVTSLADALAEQGEECLLAPDGDPGSVPTSIHPAPTVDRAAPAPSARLSS